MADPAHHQNLNLAFTLLVISTVMFAVSAVVGDLHLFAASTTVFAASFAVRGPSWG